MATSYQSWGDAHVPEGEYPQWSRWQRRRRIWSEAYQDGLGRVYKTVSEGPSSSISFTVETLYSDATNRVWKRSYPYATGETPRYTVYTYDGLGPRPHGDPPVRRRASCTVQAEIVYGNGYQTTYDEAEHTKTSYIDGLGRMTMVQEVNNGGGNYYHAYQFDALDRVTKQTNCKGFDTSVTYDSLGRKLTHQTPDTGSVTYRLRYERPDHRARPTPKASRSRSPTTRWGDG